MNLSSLKLNLPRLKQRDITLIILVVTLLLAVAWYFYMFNPSRDRIRELDVNISDLQAEIAQGENAKANLPELEANLARAQQARDDFLAELPQESEVARLLDSFRQEATDNNIVLSSINRSSSRFNGIADVRALGFSLSTTGDFGSTMGFLSSLETLKRFTKLGSVSFSVQSDGSTDNPELNTNYELDVFVYTGSAGE